MYFCIKAGMKCKSYRNIDFQLVNNKMAM